LILLAGACALACTSDYPEIAPGQVRAFKIPVVRQDESRDSTLCLVSVPGDYNADRSWPMLVALHGYGSGAEPFHTLWKQVTSSTGYVLVTPQGEEPTAEGIGWAWGTSGEEVIRRSIDAAAGAVHIERDRIFLTGFSQGGWLTYDLALKHPRVFRGIAPLGAGRNLPDTSGLDALRGTRVYIGHGDLEPGLEDVRSLAAALRSHGCEVLLREYPGVGHSLPEPISAELVRILDFLGGGQ
jgi:phospholipase/carboxylesterase